MSEVTKTSRIDFKELLKKRATSVMSQVRQRKIVHTGEPLFTAGEVMNTLNPIARLFRMICVLNHVTTDDLFDKHKEYCERISMMPTAINTDKHNLRKALAKPCMTIGVMTKLLDILGYNLVDISYTLLNTKNGEVTTFSYSDTEKEEFQEILGRSNRSAKGYILDSGSLEDNNKNEITNHFNDNNEIVIKMM